MRTYQRLAFLGVARQSRIEHFLVLGIMNGATPDMAWSNPLISRELIEELAS